MNMDEGPQRSDGGAAVDTRKDVTRVLSERGDAIVSDSVAIFPYSGPKPLDTDYCERLGRRLLGLIAAGVEGRLPADNDGLTELPAPGDRSRPPAAAAVQLRLSHGAHGAR